MANDRISILLEAQLDKKLEAKIQRQLDTLAKKLKLNLSANIGSSGRGSSSGGSGTNNEATSWSSAEKNLQKYSRGLNSLIHNYKTGKMTVESFTNAIDKKMKDPKFNEIAWKKQEQAVSLYSSAIKKLGGQADATFEANRKLTEQASKEQKYKQDSIALVNKLDAQQQKSAQAEVERENKKYSIKQQKAANYDAWWNSALSQKEEAFKKSEDAQDKIADNARLNTQSDLYSQLNSKLSKQADLESKIIKAGNEKAKSLKSVYEQQLKVNKAEQSEIENKIKTGGFTNQTKENELLQKRQQIQEKINVATARGQDGLDKSARTLGDFGKEMGIAIQRTIEWSLSMGLVYGALRSIKDAISFISEVDKNLTNIRVVTGKTAEEMSAMAQSYNSLAKELGSTTNELLTGATEWFRQGKTQAETAELLRSTMMMSKLAAIDSAQATEYLTSTLNGYQLGANKATSVVDKLVAVDNAAATSVSELGEALKRSSNSAQQAGVGLDRLVGYVGVVSSVTRKSARFGALCYNT